MAHQPAVLGVMAHRGTSLPVLHLPTLLGLASRPAPEELGGGCLLLVAVGGSHLALAVDSLNEIEPLAWVDPAPATSQGAGGDDPEASPSDALRSSRLIQVGDSETLLRELDLSALAASVAG